MPDWDQDSERLGQNLRRLLRKLYQEADKRKIPVLAMAKEWHACFMSGLETPDSRFVGAYRGEPGLEKVQVKVGRHFGVAASKVAEELARFEMLLQALVASLDAKLPIGQEPNSDELAAILDVCAWAHSEWVRIHPFANGNGRTSVVGQLHCAALRTASICSNATAT